MSAKAIGWAWELDIDARMKLLALYLADCSGDDGGRVTIRSAAAACSMNMGRVIEGLTWLAARGLVSFDLDISFDVDVDVEIYFTIHLAAAAPRVALNV